MIKIVTVLFSFFCVSQLVFSQEKQKDSAIYINEVVVKKSPAFKIKSKLSRSETIGFNEGESFVTLVKNIPNLKFSSITLYFGYKNSNEIENDYEFELLLLSNNNENKPGETILQNPVKFKVKTGNFKKIELDLRNLEIENQSEIFVGFRTVNLKNRAIAVQFHKNENAISYAKNETRDWFTPVRAFPLELKFDIEFEEK